MRRTLRLAIVLGVGAIAALAVPVVAAGPDETATVRFGNPTAGTDFPPPSGHDASANASDNLIPRTVVIGENGRVTYDISVLFGFHQPMVYGPGTTPDDITVTGFPFMIPSPGLVEAGPVVGPGPGTGGTPVSATWTTAPGTFDDPGRYLVLCNFTPHFEAFQMYGWVEVK